MPAASTLAVIALGASAVAVVAVWALSTARTGPPLLARSGRALVPLPPEQCMAAVAAIVAGSTSARSVSHSPDDLALAIRTRGSPRSFGEQITVEARNAEGGSLVDVHSRPVSWAVVIDYGRNRRNVRELLDAIVARCGGTLIEKR